MYFWIVSSYWLLQIKLLWTFMYKYLCEHIFPLLLDKYLGTEWLDRMIGVSLTLWETVKLFPLQKWMYHFTFLLVEMYICTSSPAFGIVSRFNFRHSNRYVVVSPCGFILYFPKDYCCWASFYVLFFHHLYIFFHQVSIQVFCLFKKTLGAPGWLSQLSIQLLISAQVLRGSWVRAPHWALHWQCGACLGFSLSFSLSQNK